ncbi:MAG TPA: contact-dependent growth inhibition system immunity protein [Ktedonobacteraceae bacterium]|nr:contact-dependent growth inhibition system immunity protein [Ktedonobacteraceae bacterium]
MTEENFSFRSWLSNGERGKTLQELEKQDWGDGSYFPSHLVLTTHALRRKLLEEFTVEDLRIMIGQNIGLEYLVPLAIEYLQHDPFVAGDFYEGDLLANVLSVEASFWQRYPDLRRVIAHIVETISPLPKIFHKALLTFQQNSGQAEQTSSS